ncbi:MAG: ROK family transcriptional regulator [Pseudomonadota bacterium]
MQAMRIDFGNFRARASGVRGTAGPNRAVAEDLRRFNRGLALERIFFRGIASRNDIARDTGLTGAAISRITRELLDAGLIRERQSAGERNGRGRPVTALELAPNGAFVIGVGIGAYEQWIQIANHRGECVSRRAVQLLKRKPLARALQTLIREAHAMVSEAGIPWHRVLGVTVAVAGVVDHERGNVLYSPNIGWDEAVVAEPLQRGLKLPVRVEALHHALNLAEARFGATRGAKDVVLVNAALGIGASVMEAGRIVRGNRAAAGQIGHMRVAGASELCTCGRRGCLDTVASGYAVLRRLGKVGSRRIPREHNVDDARRLVDAIEREKCGDAKAQAAFRASGGQLADALNAIRAVLDPEKIVLAGPLAQTGSYVEGIRSRLDVQGSNSSFLCLATQSSDTAAVQLALSQFVFCSSLDLARLLDG